MGNTKKLKLGPIGNGWVCEVRTHANARYVARWNAYVIRNGVRLKVSCGPYELGPKVHAGPGLKTLAAAKKEWDKVRWAVFEKQDALYCPAHKHSLDAEPSADMSVADFIGLIYEPRRVGGMEENSRLNWEYYRDAFLLPFFGERTLAQMNDEDLIHTFMQKIGVRHFSEHTAKKAFTYVKAILDTARDLGCGFRRRKIMHSDLMPIMIGAQRS